MRGIAAYAGLTAAGIALLAALSLPALAQDAQPKWGPHIDLEAKPGTKRSLGEADLFIPVLQDATTLLFGSVRMRMDDNDGNEGNYGLGLRHMLDSGWNLGAYGYFDRRRSEFGNYFNQATFGIEALSLDWDARANYYAPVGRRSHNVDSLNMAEISSTSVVFRGGEERSLGGFDAELGWRVPVFDVNDGKALRVYGGGYRFTADNVPDVSGPRARAEMTFDSILWEGSRFSLGAEWQHDDPRGSQGFLTARLRIPLQVYGKPASSLTPMERRMADPIVRDIDVVSQAGRFSAPEVVTQTASGQTFTVLNSKSTSGAGLPGAIAAAGNNSTVILAGNFNTTATTTLQAGQTVMAGTIPVRSPSGRPATLTISSTIAGEIFGNTVQMGASSTLSGMTVSNTYSLGGGSAVAVGMQGVAGATVVNNTISATTTGTSPATALMVIGSTNATISGNTLTANAITGQNAKALLLNTDGGLALSATISGNTLSASGGTNSHTALERTAGSLTILAGSSGNVVVSGGCSTVGAVDSGAISYASGTTCP